jgi:hypothetical protein
MTHCKHVQRCCLSLSFRWRLAYDIAAISKVDLASRCVHLIAFGMQCLSLLWTVEAALL